MVMVFSVKEAILPMKIRKWKASIIQEVINEEKYQMYRQKNGKQFSLRPINIRATLHSLNQMSMLSGEVEFLLNQS